MKVRITITLEPIAARGVTSADASSGAVVELPVWSAARMMALPSRAERWWRL
jgi:hypothetical protein